MKTVLITGCSSGYGLETARHFQSRGWNVAPFPQPILAEFAQPAAVTTESDVADAVWRAANDASGQLRFPAGPDAVALAESRVLAG